MILIQESGYPARKCPVCGVEFRRHHRAITCHSCSRSRERALAKRRKEAGSHGFNWVAHRIVSVAVFNGFLPPADQFYCVDCGAPAKEYDHRDYNKPLDVEPVCQCCNQKRGHGLPMIPAKITDELRQWHSDVERASPNKSEAA